MKRTIFEEVFNFKYILSEFVEPNLMLKYHFLLDLESVIALQTDLTSDEELSTTIDLGDAQVDR